MNLRQSLRKIPYLRFFIVTMVLTVAAGWLLTNFLGGVAEKEFKKKLDQESNLMASLLHDYLGDVDSVAKSLSQAEPIVAALSSGSTTELEYANRLLERYKINMGMSICYLLDENGLAIASSNRDEKNSFVGKSFAFRPFVKEALAGRLNTYFALGVLTHERGYFAAAPVLDSSGAITGVVVIKKSIDPLGEIFRKHTHGFLVSPEGIIFISSREKLIFRTLWPVTESRRPELLASQQFGEITFEPLLAAEPRTGDYVRLGKEEYCIQRLPFGSDGWTLILMEQPQIIASYRLFGILLTVVFALLILFFFSLLQNKNKSLEAAKELLKSRNDWKRTFDTVPDLIATIDSNHRIINMNRAMAERLGISQNEAVGRRCCELVHGSQEPAPSCPHQRSFFSGMTEAETLFELNLKGDFIVTASPVLAEDGTVESTVHVMHDVSELKQLERSLQGYAQRLEFVLEGSNDATWEWDMVTNQGIINTRYYAMTEYTPGEIDITLEFFLSTLHPEDLFEVQRILQDTLEGKTAEYQAHYRMVTKSGKIKNVMDRGKIVRYDEAGRPNLMAGVVTDVTEMKRLSEEVNRINNLASVGLLAGGLAHDFNNVLNIIYGNIIFAKMFANGDATIAEPLTDAEEACERAKELSVRLQALALGNSVVKEPILLPDIFEEAARILLKGSNISHAIAAADGLHRVEADPRQIRQVFDNLLTNAKDAMSAGGSIKIDIDNYLVDGKNGQPLGSGSYVCIALEDDGEGIPEENLPKIFDPYFSTKDTYSQRGMGLGLTICHAILKKHSGHIFVESKLGVGTRVAIYLPASVVETRYSSESSSGIEKCYH